GDPRGRARRRMERAARAAHGRRARGPYLGRAALPGLSRALGAGLAVRNGALDARARRGGGRRGAHRRRDPRRVPPQLRRLDPAFATAALARRAGVARAGRRARRRRVAGVGPRPRAGRRRRGAGRRRHSPAARDRRERARVTAIVFGVAIAAGALAALWPWLAPRTRPWPAELAGRRDDVARAVSSLRDLEFAEAAGTIDPADAMRLRGVLERGAFSATPAAAPRGAPIRTLGIAALLVGIAAALAAQSLPPAAGDRAPGE